MSSPSTKGPLAARLGIERVLGALLGLVLVACVALVPTQARADDLGDPQLREAQAAMVVDSEGNVLYSKNPDVEINMASITKIMTAVVALESGTPLDTVVQLHDVSLMDGAVVAGYREGMTSSLYDLMRVMLVKSANDAAEEVAIAIGGSEEGFVQMMNDKASELGLEHTHFANPHGLDADGHYSSVADLTKLARYALTTQPLIAETVRLTRVTAPVGARSVTFETTDQMLSTYKGMLGIKTGVGNQYTSFLGCARRGGVTLYTCVLGCTTKQGRFDDTARLLDWAWRTYDRHELAWSYATVDTRPYAYRFGLSCAITSDRDLTGLVWPAGGVATFRKTMENPSLTEPGSTVGVCQWAQDGRVIASATYSARPRLVRSYSGLGLFDRLSRARADLDAA